MEHCFQFFLTVLTVVALLVIRPCSFERLMQIHRRGNISYPKTMKMWSDTSNKLVDIVMESNANEELYDPDKTIKYYIQKKDQKSPSEIDLKMIGSDNKDIHKNGTWYFSMHGHQGSYIYSPMIPELVAAIHENRSANVIHVDWSIGAASNIYPIAAANTKPTGISIAKVIRRLVEIGLAKKDLIHLVGFSLGGHVVGFIGKTLFKNLGWKPWRITSLDPAGPYFNNKPPEERIDPTDGEYVEVFHTSQMGLYWPHGHVDIYVNRGSHPQPGCESALTPSCSHQFAKTVYGNHTHLPMIAYRCTSFEDFKNGNCSHDCKSPCTIGFGGKNCREGIYQVVTQNFIE